MTLGWTGFLVCHWPQWQQSPRRSDFGVGSQFGEKLLDWVSSVTPNWALTPILRAIVHSLKPITMESAAYALNWPLALMCKALVALNLEAVRTVP